MSDPVPYPRRRLFRRLSTAALVATVTLAGGAGVAPGPFGGDPADAQPVPAGSPGVTRYFGRGAYDGIRAAVAATPRACPLSDDELTALVMAPVFKEVSMAETPETAPSPMTLSRWDDSAGVGAPFTAAELMDVQYVAGDVAAGMANRYCAAGGDGYAQRAAAWQPWQALGGIAKSEALFQEMVGIGTPPFSRIGLVDGIEVGGGMQARTCILGGQAQPCWYVDPARAQGANWWALDDPTGGAVASGEAPLPAPFYVVKRSGYEERHFMAVDTGYGVNLAGSRLLGMNARPRDGQPGSGVAWSLNATDLCDTARPEMGCTPPPPPPAPEPEAAPAPTDGSGAPAAGAAPAPPALPVPLAELLHMPFDFDAARERDFPFAEVF